MHPNEKLIETFYTSFKNWMPTACRVLSSGHTFSDPVPRFSRSEVRRDVEDVMLAATNFVLTFSDFEAK